MFTSQPFGTLPSQLAKPTRQETMPHTPAVQAGDAFAGAQGVLQAPQCARSDTVLVSQPVEAMASQSAHPLLQLATVQTPAEQPEAPFTTTQALPHAPQLAGSVAVAISQPSPISPLQSEKPGAQAATQALATHAAAPLAIGEGHATAQLPQCALELDVSVSHPFATSPSQSANVPLQLPIAHVPPTHFEAAFGRLQALPQNPQLCADVRRFVSQPATLSQSPKPAGQPEGLHMPL